MGEILCKCGGERQRDIEIDGVMNSQRYSLISVSTSSNSRSRSANSSYVTVSASSTEAAMVETQAS